MRNSIAAQLKKKIALWLFVFSPFIVYPQYLEPEDVDVLINNWDTVSGAMNETAKTDEEAPAWEAFDERGQAVIDNFMDMIGDAPDSYSDDPAGFENFKRSYAKFMNGRTPPSLQIIFESIGWEKRGLQKLFTLLFGMMFVISARIELEYDEGETNAGGRSRVLEVINKSDLKIIEDNLEKLTELIN
ncbi:MAG: hypothetical protein LBO80_08035 [Treponema sp.]|jgi:hypothetical protein|nr:hypothetical protein [Treponema sp.]